MTEQRTFTAASDGGTDDEPITVFLSLLSHIVWLQRGHGLKLTCIYLNPALYGAICLYMNCTSVDMLFGVPVQANLNVDCMPFTIASEDTSVLVRSADE